VFVGTRITRIIRRRRRRRIQAVEVEGFRAGCNVHNAATGMQDAPSIVESAVIAWRRQDRWRQRAQGGGITA